MKRVALTVVAIGLLIGPTGCQDANQSAPSVDAQAGVDCAYPAAGTPAKPVDPPAETGIAKAGTATATLHFKAGDVALTMNREAAPCTVNSFLSLAQQGYFDDTVCHRLVDTGIFILQCGDPSATGAGGPGYTIPDETDPGMTYPAGTVAMANRGGNAATGGSQFFLVWADTPLPPEYTVFGTMDKAGIDVVAGIAAEGIDAADQTSPIADASIVSVSVG
ncbi:MAG: peptidylprolyl isomerase [Arachnia propionica]|nr:MAG: peptidylprolyl isomerase [Arachnia propionica]